MVCRGCCSCLRGDGLLRYYKYDTTRSHYFHCAHATDDHLATRSQAPRGPDVIVSGNRCRRARRMWLNPGVQGGMPSWLREGIQGLLIENAPYALAGPTPVAGFILADPLTAGARGPSKILWVVSTPRNGRPLEIRVNPSGADEPVLRVSRPADSGPGEIYPDGVSVPNSGCWHFKLQWATGNAELDLSYSP